MTESQYRTTADQPINGRGRAEESDARSGEQTVDAVVATADAVQASLREGQDAAAAVAQQWAARFAGIPFTALSGGGVASVVSGRVWVDYTAEMIDVLLAVQRRSLNRLVTVQCRTAGLMAESGLALAAAGWQVLGGTPAGGSGHGTAS
jgi:hypothetical protein